MDEHLQARLQAKQEIEMRCSRFNGQDVLALAEPAAGDAFGDRYREALNVLSRAADPTRRQEAVLEMARQGMAPSESAVRVLGSLRTWRGESWQHRELEFDTSTGIALRLATSGNSDSTADLRDLVSCDQGGRCIDFLSRQLAGIPADRRQIVESLARDMAASLRAGDVAPWLPAKAEATGG